jgi:hypothetical protein
VNGQVSGWDSEWFYHLPFPFKGVQWLEISLLSHGEPTQWIVDLVQSIGFEYSLGNDFIRIYGYGPREEIQPAVLS